MLKGKLKFLGIFVLGVVVGLLVLTLLAGLGSWMSIAPSYQGGEIMPLESPLGISSYEYAQEDRSYGDQEESVADETESRLVIKTGSLNMVVKDVAGTARKIIQYAESKGGWVVSSSISEQEEVPRGTVTVRVPVENFENATAHFRVLAEKVSHEGSQGQDVTEEYTDLESQLRNLEVTESQLQKIMDKAWKISEVLEVQRELTRVREQIERLKGRMQYLERSAKMATITVNLALSEDLLPIPPTEKWRPVYVFREAWRNVLGALRNISYLAIWVVVYAIIWVPISVIIWAGVKFGKRRAKI